MDRHSPVYDRLIAGSLAILTILLLLFTEPLIGLTWDEPAYIVASESYVRWLRELPVRPGYALSADGIQHYWDPNHEHPPLDKLWAGLVWAAARNVLDDLAAHRLGNMILVGGLIAMLYLMVMRSYGRLAGLSAAAALLTMPRFFFHAHLTALDVPAAVTFFAVIYLFWVTRERRGLGWGVLLGVGWGLGLATKINAAFVMPILLAWVLVFDRRWEQIIRLVIAGMIGPIVFVALWPWLYYDTVDRLIAYIRFITVDHWKIGQWYLGVQHMPPPWHFPFVMMIAVVPLALLLLAILGIIRTILHGRGETPGWLLIGGAIVPMLALTTGKAMVYDNERLFMPTFPYLAALAGVGMAWLIQALPHMLVRTQAQRYGLATMIAIAIFTPHTTIAARQYPHLLSYYSETIGGLQGAERLQLETTYWCETYAAALPFINRYAKPGAIVWVESWSHDVMFYYKLQGRLRPDIQVAWERGAATVFSERARGVTISSMNEADFVVIQYRQTGFKDDMRAWIANHTAAFQLQQDGVPIMDVYTRK